MAQTLTDIKKEKIVGLEFLLFFILLLLLLYCV